jgi:hypothetical protein
MDDFKQKKNEFLSLEKNFIKSYEELNEKFY